jgi:hypothetical protein
MTPFECPLQSREEVEVAGRQVGTVGGVVQALLTEGGNMVDRCYCCAASRIFVQKDDSYCEKARSLPPLSTTAVHVPSPCLPGTHYSVVLYLTLHCAGTACAMKVVRPTTNEEVCLWTQNTVTSHQFYAVPGNKMGTLIFRLSYVN